MDDIERKKRNFFIIAGLIAVSVTLFYAYSMYRTALMIKQLKK